MTPELTTQPNSTESSQTNVQSWPESTVTSIVQFITPITPSEKFLQATTSCWPNLGVTKSRLDLAKGITTFPEQVI
jgi:hypothetical protein